MQDLLAGFRQFRRTRYHTEAARLRWLARRGQSPKALVIACSDSRVDPQMVFAAAPGDLFTVRNVANLVPPYQPTGDYHGTSAAIEFGVRGLRVRHIIVMGHSGCGGVRALLSDERDESDFVGPWMAIAESAKKCCRGHEGEEAQRMGELAVIRVSLRNLMTFPWIRERVEAGELTLEGMLFDIAAGRLLRLDPATDEFLPVEEDEIEAPRRAGAP